ncbi:hypothetical protein CYMTET_44476 [Cymbomonas tetramitiformis]|uniref:Uncharacterized protein n=1 Tax=Cymbomonas tetramitiformis TaxID=36881 RepID=A0AAE0C050_9CHLO|nr:hypothetical protein CYMTET_44476 [Cymbomonas tetramitiformis]
MTPVSKDFYRARYDMFGFCDAPKHQAEMARVFKRMFDGTVHLNVKSQCSGIFVDNGHSVAYSDLSLEEATARTQAEIAQLEAAEASEQQYPLGTPVPRRELAAVVGKFQFLAPLIRGGQNILTPLYRARDRFTDPVVATHHAAAQWEDCVTVEMDREARDALGQFCQALRARPTRRYYLEKDPAISGWWTGQHSRYREYLTEHWSTPEGVPAPTMDASGWQGGVAYRDFRHILTFPPDECAPLKSSNFREASTAASAVELLGPQLRGSQILLRTDNTTTMSITNRQGTMSPELWLIMDRMFKAAVRHDLDLAAEHIPGVENGLADGLSRFVKQKDYSDWQYRADEFHTFLESDICGEDVYANPDFTVIFQYLTHFHSCQKRAPQTTTGTFVLPLWDTYEWWHLLKGARVVKYYPAESHLFTSPEWRHLLREDGTYGFGAERAFRGPTQWPVLVVYFPSTLPSSRCWARRARLVHCTGRMAAQVSELLGMRTRLSTDEGHRRGIRDVEAYMRAYLDHGLPATGTDVVCYAAYSVEMREFTLDSSTVRTYLAGLSAWHVELSMLLKEAGLVDSVGCPLQLANLCRQPQVLGLLQVLDRRYKKPSRAKDAFTPRQWCRIFHFGFVLSRRSGRHHRLLFLFCMLGCLRRGGTKYLRAFYELLRKGGPALDLDKNADSRKPRRFYMPAEVPALGLRPVELLEDYIIQEGVPSGSLLFAAPKGGTGWYAGPYTGHGRAFKQGLQQGLPAGPRAYRVYSGWDHQHTLLVCYGGWQLVQPLMAEIAVVASGHGSGTGFAVEKVQGVGGAGGITEVQMELLRSWGWP